MMYKVLITITNCLDLGRLSDQSDEDMAHISSLAQPRFIDEFHHELEQPWANSAISIDLFSCSRQ